MKCIKCNAELSNSVYQIHIKRCNVKKEVVKEIEPIIEESEIVEETEIIESEELEIKPEEYTLEQLLQMALDNPDRKDAPSTIKRWNIERLKKELNL